MQGGTSEDRKVDRQTEKKIMISTNEQEGTAVLSDLFGKIVWQGKVITGQKTDLSAMPNGTYILKIQTKAGIKTERIIINK